MSKRVHELAFGNVICFGSEGRQRRPGSAGAPSLVERPPSLVERNLNDGTLPAPLAPQL